MPEPLVSMDSVCVRREPVGSSWTAKPWTPMKPLGPVKRNTMVSWLVGFDGVTDGAVTAHSSGLKWSIETHGRPSIARPEGVRFATETVKELPDHARRCWEVAVVDVHELHGVGPRYLTITPCPAEDWPPAEARPA